MAMTRRPPAHPTHSRSVYPGGDPEAEAARLRALGATAVDLDRSVPWTVLADPEGSEFCLPAPA
jgi:Glyoxalase-like domain